MDSSSIIFLKALRKTYQKVFRAKAKSELTEEFATYRGQEASDIIKSKLLNEEPVMIARFGSNELNCVVNHFNITNNANRYLDYIKGEVDAFWWDKNMMQKMATGAGFFPATVEHLEKFARLMMNDMQQVDILGSWLRQEAFFKKELAHAVRLRLADLEPYYHDEPWSMALEGKKVLVVHPFENSIREQYAKRHLLFPRKMLPDFELKTIKAVQTAANHNEGFTNWFEALEYMKDKISKVDFDVAIIGCGAYGFPLAAHVKRIGKKAIHLGGATQILFGIKGKRWEERNKYISSLMNEYWIRPSDNERIQNMKKIEDGCYW